MNIKKLLGIPKSLYFNLYYFPVKTALRFPVILAADVKLNRMGRRDSVKLLDTHKRISIGFGESFALGGRTYWDVSDLGQVVFNGSAMFGKGTQIVVGGIIEFGDRFFCNANCILNAGTHIIFGDDVLLGWNCTVLDGDGHSVSSELGKQEEHKTVEIGSHVWLASGATVLKGSRIGDGCCVAANGCITKEFESRNLLLGGFNKVLREGIYWKR